MRNIKMLDQALTNQDTDINAYELAEVTLTNQIKQLYQVKKYYRECELQGMLFTEAQDTLDKHMKE